MDRLGFLATHMEKSKAQKKQNYFLKQFTSIDSSNLIGSFGYYRFYVKEYGRKPRLGNAQE
jgi:hypothetical protein